MSGGGGDSGLTMWPGRLAEQTGAMEQRHRGRVASSIPGDPADRAHRSLFQETFDAGLQAFQQEGIANITALKDQLLAAKHIQSKAIEARHAALMKRWSQLLANSATRKKKLLEAQSHFRKVGVGPCRTPPARLPGHLPPAGSPPEPSRRPFVSEAPKTD